ncbi:ubiquitin-conjugating enzyme E2 [Yamadazyma tenuis]|uniref:UBC-like protein n=1 Tax=Candida tenuis (strain ATCC 10573 / BCRC 21748 / CBS 615 / JCM 9827 / NBRC 10315 / NRRL Y-1498 / VKM Y-70) TaxID=590646 RepID=G3B0V0_CANTC|nr:UBC-like protein [Yamadazyma tenuis ATCC 10573]EGV64809.1 UBC-like protein [Yamadazyma tenuis ATCC 10573]WEJ97604.1 ubiquitin-conjugating enzyme E2 [Yamadazyma tenuis]
MSHPFYKRILKEYRSLQKATLPGIELVSNNEELSEFEFEMVVLNNHQLYKEPVKLIVKLTDEYPVAPPKVKFLQEVGAYDIPMHPHVYSNGHICLNLLGNDWTPACSIESILLSLQSMLESNTKQERPPDDARYVRYAPAYASASGFVYHDDSV